MSNDSYKPPYYATLNSALFREAVTDSGDLFVVNGDEDHVGIYKVVFGMDELSIDISDEEIEVQGDLLNKQSPISNEVNALSSEDMTYHPRVTRETAEQRALQMINLTWDLTQANKQKPAGCTHSLSIPPHVLSAPVGATMTGIPYCVAGGNGLEYLQGASAAKNINFDEAMRFGKVAGNISGVICDHAAGLDCSGYASSVYKYQNKYYSNAFLNAGKNIGTCEEYEDLNEVLDKMDLLVQISNKNHIFIFIEQKIEDNVKYIYFYNCTQNYGYTVNGERGPHNKALKGKIGKNALDTMGSDLTLHKMWNCTYSYFNYNDTQHGRMRTCNTCEPLTYLPHEFSISVVNANYHETTCYCGYRLVEGHTFSSPMPICTVCGYLRPYSKGVNGQAQLEQDFIVS